MVRVVASCRRGGRRVPVRAVVGVYVQSPVFYFTHITMGRAVQLAVEADAARLRSGGRAAW